MQRSKDMALLHLLLCSRACRPYVCCSLSCPGQTPQGHHQWDRQLPQQHCWHLHTQQAEAPHNLPIAIGVGLSKLQFTNPPPNSPLPLVKNGDTHFCCQGGFTHSLMVLCGARTKPGVSGAPAVPANVSSTGTTSCRASSGCRPVRNECSRKLYCGNVLHTAQHRMQMSKLEETEASTSCVRPLYVRLMGWLAYYAKLWSVQACKSRFPPKSNHTAHLSLYRMAWPPM